MKLSGENCPPLPMTLKLRISSVPEPVSDCPWNAEMIRCPGLAAFGVTDIPLLIVPA